MVDLTCRPWVRTGLDWTYKQVIRTRAGLSQRRSWGSVSQQQGKGGFRRRKKDGSRAWRLRLLTGRQRAQYDAVRRREGTRNGAVRY